MFIAEIDYRVLDLSTTLFVVYTLGSMANAMLIIRPWGRGIECLLCFLGFRGLVYVIPSRCIVVFNTFCTWPRINHTWLYMYACNYIFAYIHRQSIASQVLAILYMDKQKRANDNAHQPDKFISFENVWLRRLSSRHSPTRCTKYMDVKRFYVCSWLCILNIFWHGISCKL